MAAVDVTGKVSPRQIQRIAMQGKPTDDYTTEGDSAPATWTVTYEYTKSGKTCTIDYSET